MGKHTLEIEYDYDFVLIGISSHEKDYRLCWMMNNKLGLELAKANSLEIKGKKQDTPSFFSLFTYENPEAFMEYAVIANWSESKSLVINEDSLFDADKIKDRNHSENEWLIPEHKQMNYFFIIKGEIEEKEINEIIKKIKELDVVQTGIRIDATQLKSKQNIIF